MSEEIKNMGKIISLHAEGIINQLREPLTIEKLKTFEGMENLSDEEAQEIVYSIHTLCNIIYEYTMSNKIREEPDNNIQKLAA
jgi:hypothetical protein